jgi:hypothetical protein
MYMLAEESSLRRWCLASSAFMALPCIFVLQRYESRDMEGSDRGLAPTRFPTKIMGATGTRRRMSNVTMHVIGFPPLHSSTY